MIDYHIEVVALLVQYKCQRLDHIGQGIYKWHSPITNVVFNVDSSFPSLKAANSVLERAGIGALIKPKKGPIT